MDKYFRVYGGLWAASALLGGVLTFFCVAILLKVQLEASISWFLVSASITAGAVVSMHKTRHPDNLHYHHSDSVPGESDDVLGYKWLCYMVMLSTGWIMVYVYLETYEINLAIMALPFVYALAFVKLAMVWYRPGAIEGIILVFGTAALMILFHSLNVDFLIVLFQPILCWIHKELYDATIS